MKKTYKIRYHVIPAGSMIMGGKAEEYNTYAESEEQAEELLRKVVPDARIAFIREIGSCADRS